MEQEGLITGGPVVRMRLTNRRLTDWAMLVLFGIFTLGFIFLCGHAIEEGNPSHVTNGVDFEHNFCGSKNGRLDLREQPFLYIADPSHPKASAVCVKECPDKEQYPENDANSYICRYKAREGTLQEKIARLNTECWLAYKTRAYLHGCHAQNVVPFALESTRAYYADVHSSLGIVLLYGGIIAAIVSYLVLSCLRLSAGIASWIILVLLPLMLLVVILFTINLSSDLHATAENIAPILSSEIHLIDSLDVVARFAIAILLATGLIYLIFLRSIKTGIAVIRESNARPAYVEGVVLVIASIQVLVAWVASVGVTSIASRSLKIDPTANSYMELSSDNAVQIFYLVFGLIWFELGLTQASNFLVSFSSSAYILNGPDSGYLNEASSATLTQLGTILLSSLVLSVFGPLVSTLTKTFPGLYSSIPWIFLSYGTLTQSALSGDAYVKSSLDHARTAAGAPGSIALAFSSRLVHFIFNVFVAVMCVLLSWQSIGQHIHHVSYLSTVTVPAGLVFILSYFVSSVVMAVSSAGCTTCVFICATEMGGSSEEGGKIRSSSALRDLILEAQEPATATATPPKEQSQAPAQVPVAEVKLPAAQPESKKEVPQDKPTTKAAVEASAMKARNSIAAAEEQMNKLLADMDLPEDR